MLNRTIFPRALVAVMIMGAGLCVGAGEAAIIDPDASFTDNVVRLCSRRAAVRGADVDALVDAFAVESDWICQDTGEDIGAFLKSKDPASVLRSVGRGLSEGELGPLLDNYLAACAERRADRLRGLREEHSRIVFLKNVELGNAPRGPLSLSNGPYKGKPFSPGAGIYMVDLADPPGTVTTLLHDSGGMIRDLDVSYDGERILFAWKKSLTEDDYHVYEMSVGDRRIRQVTAETGVADFQARYLYDGIVYHSSRCSSVVDCNEAIGVVNMYTSDLDGGNIRRLSYDQVSTQYPTVMRDGRIIYTRWEYNDRGQIYPQGLFVMNPDGTKQMAVYGNNSWYPTSLIQARDIPGSQKLAAVIAGHHTPPCGKLALIDLGGGRDEGKGITLLAPVRDIEYGRVDKACQDDVLFQYPYPLNEDEFLVGFSLFGRKKSQEFGIYYMHSDGSRELLAWDAELSCRQAMPLSPRKILPRIPDAVDFSSDTGVYYVDNVYWGEGLKGIEPGTVKRLRVIALDYRAAAVGISFNRGPAGHARVDTPVSVGGAWDTKTVLGDAEVYEDGSACFRVPARTPVYFQAIDEDGMCVQSMRSWSTLQPGESFSCVGCHEDKNAAPAVRKTTIAMEKGPRELSTFYGPARGFSFLKEVQPILDRHCIECHSGRPYDPPAVPAKEGSADPPFCFWPAKYSRGVVKQAILHLGETESVGAVSIDWLKEGGKDIRSPSKWSLSYKDGPGWKRIRAMAGASERVSFPSVTTDAFLVTATMPKDSAGGIGKWMVYDSDGKRIDPDDNENAFSLLNREVYEDISGRVWAESYLALLKAGFSRQGEVSYHLNAFPNTLVNWISPQSGPTVLEPYSFGAAQSELMAMLGDGHEGVSLSRKEMDILSCWIDLAVPYCGDYLEGNTWTGDEMRRYNRRLEERDELSRLEAAY